jgi:hypothetical protein
MQVFFGPAIRLINKLSYAGKLVVVALILSLTCAESSFLASQGGRAQESESLSRTFSK